MPVSVITHIPNLPAEAYDAIAAQQAAPLREARGFIAHTAAVSPDGVTVTEIWEQRDDWQRFFEERVEPHLPPGLPAPAVAELHNVIH
jgi:heme-degrading monooxygenase HmoA